MKSNKKNLIIISFLLVIILGLAFDRLYLKPTNRSIDLLEIEKQDKEMQLMEQNTKILSEPNLDSEIMRVNKDLAVLSEPLFVDIKQEEALKITNNLADQNIIINSVGFIESEDQETGGKIIEESLDIDSDYLSMMRYMGEIRKYNKNIAITQLSFVKNSEYLDNGDKDEDKDEGGQEESTKIKTKLVLQYSSVPELRRLGIEDQKLLSDVLSKRDMSVGPFAAYEGYVSAIEIEPETTETTEYNLEFDYENYIPKTPVYDFEDASSFFVGSQPDIVGHVLRSHTRKSGGYSSDLYFDFITAREYNCANLVFENDRITLSKQPKRLFIQIYAYEASNHSIGVNILDSSGNDYKVYLADGVDWVGWKELSVELPTSIKYPCLVQRIFVEGVGFEQKVTGRYLFDQMEVEFP